MTRRFYVLVAFAIIFALVSCGTEETRTGLPSDLDASDPTAVAQAAWQAIKAEDFDAYVALVSPDSRQRETRAQWLESIRKMKQAPGFPMNPKLVVTTQEEPNRAVAATEDLRLSMGMVFKDSRWWMD